MCSSEHPTKTPGPIGLSPPSSEGRSGLVHPGTDDRQAASSTEYYYTSRSYTYEQKQQERALTWRCVPSSTGTPQLQLPQICVPFWTRLEVTCLFSLLDANSRIQHYIRDQGSPGLNQGQHPARTSAPYKAEEGSESRAPSGRRHRWKATPRRLGHPTRAINHRHVMRVLIWSSQRSTTRHNGSDATAQFQLVRGQFTFSHGHSQSCAQVQGKGGEMD